MRGVVWSVMSHKRWQVFHVTFDYMLLQPSVFFRRSTSLAFLLMAGLSLFSSAFVLFSCGRSPSHVGPWYFNPRHCLRIRRLRLGPGLIFRMRSTRCSHNERLAESVQKCQSPAGHYLTIPNDCTMSYFESTRAPWQRESHIENHNDLTTLSIDEASSEF